MDLDGNRSRWELVALLPFAACVLLLRLMGWVFHLNYKQISVAVNLWLQGALLCLSSLLPSTACLLRAWRDSSWNLALGGLLLLGYASVFVALLAWMVRRYSGPSEVAFDRCVEDLLGVAAHWHLSYYAVNLIIFVLWFLALVGLHVTFFWMVMAW